MKVRNMEFKARIGDPDAVRQRLMALSPRTVGTDRQKDTYFRVPEGRLKVREGDIEKSVIFYRRSNDPTTRESEVEVVAVEDPGALRRLLALALPTLATVTKHREIYYVDDTKIHIDLLDGRSFLEVEASDERKASFFRDYFGVRASDIEGRSYSDMQQVPICSKRAKIVNCWREFC